MKRYAICLMLLGNSMLAQGTTISTPQEAIDKARTAWENIYSKTNRKVYSPDEVKLFEPYAARLVDGYWIVEGTIPAEFSGQTLTTKISRDTGVTSVETRIISKSP